MKHKDPNGEICKGKKDLSFETCWHCDTCPLTECGFMTEQEREHR